jgi:hypothetical protein
MLKVRTTLTLLGIAAALIAGALAIPASAAPVPPDGPDGKVYVWDSTGFSGTTYCTWYGDDGDYRFNNGCGNWNDRVSSAWNYGYNNAFPDVLFFENINYSGASKCLHNGEAWSSMPPGWDNRVSSHKWVNCN